MTVYQEANRGQNIHKGKRDTTTLHKERPRTTQQTETQHNNPTWKHHNMTTKPDSNTT